MKTLNIKGDSALPSVQFNDKGKLFMGGSALPENPKEFFEPIMQWIETYKENTLKSTEIEFNFDYLNTASTNMMARIIESINEMKQSQTVLSITWYYTHGDYDMKELGEELLEDTSINYSIKEIKI